MKPYEDLKAEADAILKQISRLDEKVQALTFAEDRIAVSMGRATAFLNSGHNCLAGAWASLSSANHLMEAIEVTQR